VGCNAGGGGPREWEKMSAPLPSSQEMLRLRLWWRMPQRPKGLVFLYCSIGSACARLICSLSPLVSFWFVCVVHFDFWWLDMQYDLLPRSGSFSMW
jgi:hypothetical protein